MKEETTDANASLETSTPLGYYKWYPRDFLASSTVRKMSVTAQGVYRCLLDLQWEDGIVPADYEEACLIIGASQQEAEAFKSFFGKCFPEGINPKLHEQRLESIAHIMEQKRRGKAGAEKKARLKTQADAEPPLSHRLATAEPVLSPTTTTTATTTNKIEKRANASSSKKSLDYLALAQEKGFEDDMFLKAWSEFVAHRKEIKHPMTERAAELILGKLKKHSIEVGVEAMNRAISSGWRDCFPEKVASQLKNEYGKTPKVASALSWISNKKANEVPDYIQVMIDHNAKEKEKKKQNQKALESNNVIDGEVIE